VASNRNPINPIKRLNAIVTNLNAFVGLVLDTPSYIYSVNHIQHELYMRYCLSLAKQGHGYCSPNPMVGSVIVQDNEIISRGYHEYYGGDHAEVNALNSLSGVKNEIKDAILYVNLEPCNHYGKTGPCSKAIVEAGISTVVIGNVDPNPLVAGSGIKYLKDAGVEVIHNVLDKECAELNRRFFTFQEKNRPYIILKWAQTRDGYFYKNRSSQNWISNELSKQLVHKWRSQEDAVLVGANTVLADNPQLTNRLYGNKQPCRIILARKSLTKDYNVFNNQAPTLYFEDFDLNKSGLEELLKELAKRQIQSVIVEGGLRTLELFVSNNLWDEARVITGTISWNEGTKALNLSGHVAEQYYLGGDELTTLRNL